MRRSKAPSVLKEAKNLCNNNDSDVKFNCSGPDDLQYSWGSRDHTRKFKESGNENKRIFNVLWRDVSMKKRKTWKGDGTLEVNDVCLKAVLKDETGKYMGYSTKFNNNNLVPGFQMVIGGKEIEIQNEMRDEGQLDELRKKQAEKLNSISSEDLIDKNKKLKDGFKYNSALVLNEMSVTKMHLETKKTNLNFNRVTYEIQKPVSYSQRNIFQNKSHKGFYRELICFLRPSELQQFLFQKVLEYSNSTKYGPSLSEVQSFDIENVLQNICNHPSLIKNIASTNKLMHLLMPVLPDWTEMGTFDSGKLEFVQYFLTDLKNCNPQTCIIFATNFNVLNMLQGLCDFINIKCLRLITSQSEVIEPQLLIKFCSEEKSTQVLLVNSLQFLNGFDLFTYCNKLIIFEEVYENLNICRLENCKDIIIYNLVTAFSIEEILLLDSHKNDSSTKSLLIELTNILKTENDCCYLHSKIECNCFKSTDFNRSNIFIKDWKHFKNPYDMQLLKNSSLENSSENIITIFCKANTLFLPDV